MCVESTCLWRVRGVMGRCYGEGERCFEEGERCFFRREGESEIAILTCSRPSCTGASSINFRRVQHCRGGLGRVSVTLLGG